MASPAKRARDGDAPANETNIVDRGLLDGLVGYHLRRAQAVVFDDFRTAMADENITPGQFGVLCLIDANAAINQSALARALGIERSTMVAVITALEDRGLVARLKSDADRRSYVLALTPPGAATLARACVRVTRHEARVGADLDTSETATLIALLRRIHSPD